MEKSHRLYLVYLSLMFSLVLAVVPLPAMVKLFRPDWPLLVLFYWALALPFRVSIGTAFVVGFLLDVLVGTVLGVNALAYSIIIYFCSAHHLKIRNFSILQQSVVIALFLAFYHYFIFWLSHFLTGVVFTMAYLWPVVTGAAVWPWIFWLLRRIRRQFKIH